MSSGDETAPSLSRPQYGQVIRTARPQPGPRCRDCCRSELGHQGRRRATQSVDRGRLYCLIKAHVFHRRADQNLARTAWHHVDIEGIDDVLKQTAALWLKVEKLALARLYRGSRPCSPAIDHRRRGKPAGVRYDFNIVTAASGTYRLDI